MEIRLTAAELAAATGMPEDRATVWLPPIYAVTVKYELNTPRRLAMWLSQCTYESEGFSKLEEDLDYSADELVKEWPAHFTVGLAQAYAHHPELIANRAYAGRYGNGSETSGDGWLFRGRGAIQITFRANYAACGAALGEDLIGHPERLAEPELGALSAGWFWGAHNLNALADAGDVPGVTARVTGGASGLVPRTAGYVKTLSILGGT